MNFERHEFPPLEVSPSQLKGVLQCVLHSVLFNRALGAFFPKDAECVEFGARGGGDAATGVSNNGMGVPYAKLDDAHVDALVDSFLDRFLLGLGKAGARQGQVCLGFHEKVAKKKSLLSWGQTAEEKVFWERWIVPVQLDAVPSTNTSSNTNTQVGGTHAADTGAASTAAAASISGGSSSSSTSPVAPSPPPSATDAVRRARLVECLTYLVFRCNEKREHIPPLKSTAVAAAAPLAFSFELSFTAGGKKEDSWGTQLGKLLSIAPPMLKLQ